MNLHTVPGEWQICDLLFTGQTLTQQKGGTHIMEMVWNLVMAAAVVILTRYLVPWLKAQLDARKETALIEKIEQYVTAAEQLIQGTCRGVEKLSYVEGLLEEDGVPVTARIRALIEAAVARLCRK